MLPSRGGRADCVSAHAAGVLIEFLPSQKGQGLFGAANFVFAMNRKRAPSSGLKPVRTWPPATFPDPAGIDRNVQCMLGVFQKLSRR
jgi:hypothetical protein